MHQRRLKSKIRKRVKPTTLNTTVQPLTSLQPTRLTPHITKRRNLSSIPLSFQRRSGILRGSSGTSSNKPTRLKSRITYPLPSPNDSPQLTTLIQLVHGQYSVKRAIEEYFNQVNGHHQNNDTRKGEDVITHHTTTTTTTTTKPLQHTNHDNIYTHPTPTTTIDTNISQLPIHHRALKQQSNLAKYTPRINSSHSTPQQLMLNMTNWLIENGSYIDERIEIKAQNVIDMDNDDNITANGAILNKNGGNNNNTDDQSRMIPEQFNMGAWGLFSNQKIPAGTIIASIPYPLAIQQLTQFQHKKNFVNFGAKNKNNNHLKKDVQNPNNPLQSQSYVPKSRASVRQASTTAASTSSTRPLNTPHTTSHENSNSINHDDDNITSNSDYSESSIDNSDSYDNDDDDDHFTIPSSLFHKISTHRFGTAILTYLHLCNIKTSPYKPYLDTLVKTYPLIMPLKFLQFDPTIIPLNATTRIDLQLTQEFTHLVHMYEDVRVFLSDNIPQFMFNEHQFDFESFHLIASILSTNSLTRPCLSTSPLQLGRAVLAPLINIIGHSNVPNVGIGFSTVGSSNLHPIGTALVKANNENNTNDGGIEDGNKSKSSIKKKIQERKDGEEKIQLYNQNLLETKDDLIHIITLTDILPNEELCVSYQPHNVRIQPTFPLLDNDEIIQQFFTKLEPLKPLLDDSDIIGNDNNVNHDVLTSNTNTTSDKDDTNGLGHKQFEQGEKKDDKQDEPKHTNQQNSMKRPNYPEDLLPTSLKTKLDNLPSTNPLSHTNIQSTLSLSLSRYPYYNVNDFILPPKSLKSLPNPPSHQPFPYLQLAYHNGIIPTGGTHLPFYINNRTAPKLTTRMPYYIQPSFLSSVINIEQILISAAHFYDKALTHLNLFNIITNPTYQQYISTIAMEHIDVVSNIHKLPQVQQLTTLYNIRLPYPSAPLPFTTTLQPNRKPLQLVLFAGEKVTIESMDYFVQFGKPKKMKQHPSYKAFISESKRQLGNINKDSSMVDVKTDENNDKKSNEVIIEQIGNKQIVNPFKRYDSSSTLQQQQQQQQHVTRSNLHKETPSLPKGVDSTSPPQSIYEMFKITPEVIKYHQSETKLIQESQLYANTTSMKYDQPAGTPPLRYPRPTIAPIDENDALNIAFPFRFGIGQISPQLEVFSYLLASYAVSFDQINLHACLQLQQIARDVFDGGSVDDDNNNEDNANNTSQYHMLDPDGSGYIFGMYKKKKSKQNIHKENAITSIVNQSSNDNNDNSHSKDHTITETIHDENQTRNNDGDNNNKNDNDNNDDEEEEDPFAQLHLPAHAILLGILDTVLSTQHPHIHVETIAKNSNKDNINNKIDSNTVVSKSTHHSVSNLPQTSLSKTKTRQTLDLPRHYTNPFQISNDQIVNDTILSVEHAKLFENQPNYVIQHLFNSIATKLGIPNQYWDLDDIIRMKFDGNKPKTSSNDDNTSSQSLPPQSQSKPKPLIETQTYSGPPIDDNFKSYINRLEEVQQMPYYNKIATHISPSTSSTTSNNNIGELKTHNGIISPVGWVSGGILQQYQPTMLTKDNANNNNNNTVRPDLNKVQRAKKQLLYPL